MSRRALRPRPGPRVVFPRLRPVLEQFEERSAPTDILGPVGSLLGASFVLGAGLNRTELETSQAMTLPGAANEVSAPFVPAPTEQEPPPRAQEASPARPPDTFLAAYTPASRVPSGAEDLAAQDRFLAASPFPNPFADPLGQEKATPSETGGPSLAVEVNPPRSGGNGDAAMTSINSPLMKSIKPICCLPFLLRVPGLVPSSFFLFPCLVF